MRSRKFANPFYALLLVAGLAFAMTATVYGVMAFRDRDAGFGVSTAANDDHPLMTWMENYGNTALMIELSVLAIGTFGAIATDDYWQRRENRSKEQGAGSRE
jgi:hypothetical protein